MSKNIERECSPLVGSDTPLRNTRKDSPDSAAGNRLSTSEVPSSVFTWLGDIEVGQPEEEAGSREQEVRSTARDSNEPFANSAQGNTAETVAITINHIYNDDIGGGGTDDECKTVGGEPYVPPSTAPAAVGDEDDVEGEDANEEGSEDESVESDYYYDDAGVSHTYYRPKRFPQRHRNPSKSLFKGEAQLIPRDGHGGDGGVEVQSVAATLRGSFANGAAQSVATSPSNAGSAVPAGRAHTHKLPSYPEDNGSIYIAPPSTRYYDPSATQQQAAGPSRLNTATNKSFATTVGGGVDNRSIVTMTTTGAAAGETRRRFPKKRQAAGAEADPNAVEMEDANTVIAESFGDDETGTVIAPYTDNKSIVALPDKLRVIGHKIDKLPVEELLYISAMVSRKANREVYSVLQYTGEAWYLPEMRRTRPGERRWDFRYMWGVGLIIAIAGRRIRFRLLSYTVRIAVMALIWFIVWCSTIPKSWSYRVGYFLDPYVTVLVSAILGGIVCRILAIPPLVGVLWVGIMWNNIGPEVGYFTKGIIPQVKTITARSGLTIIVLRAGYSINFRSVVPLIGNVFLNSATLGVESVVHAMMAKFYLGYEDWKWSFCQALICSVPAAAIVVPGVLLLQADGYSRGSGPLPLMLATMGVETPVGIWAATFTYGLISSDKDIGFLAGMGPVQIIGGAVAGFAAFCVIHLFVWILRREAERLPTGKFSEAHLASVYPRAVILILLAGHALMFLSYEIDMIGGGIVATMSMTFFLANFWAKDNDPEWLDMKANIGTRLASTWDLVAMPYLFSIAGTKIVLSKIFNRTLFPKALLVIVVSVAARFLFTGVGSLGLGFTWKERLFHMGAATSKATLQIAMGSSPLDYVTKKLAGTPLNDPGRPLLLRQKEMGEMFLATTVLSVLICAPAAAIWITRFGPYALKKE